MDEVAVEVVEEEDVGEEEEAEALAMVALEAEEVGEVAVVQGA